MYLLSTPRCARKITGPCGSLNKSSFIPRRGSLATYRAETFGACFPPLRVTRRHHYADVWTASKIPRQRGNSASIRDAIETTKNKPNKTIKEEHAPPGKGDVCPTSKVPRYLPGRKTSLLLLSRVSCGPLSSPQGNPRSAADGEEDRYLRPLYLTREIRARQLRRSLEKL